MLLSLLMSLYFACIIVCYTCNIVLIGMFTILDFSSALEYSIIRRYTHIEYCIVRQTS